MWLSENNFERSETDTIISPVLEDYDLCDQSTQCQADLGGCQESVNFASAFEALRLNGEILDSRREMLPSEKSVQTLARCPCGCLQHGGSVTAFRTRELSSLRLVIHGPEILNYQGTKQAPEDVAPYWKKDSRMWLWKSVRLARREKNKPAVLNSLAINREAEGME